MATLGQIGPIIWQKGDLNGYYLSVLPEIYSFLPKIVVLWGHDALISWDKNLAKVGYFGPNIGPKQDLDSQI